MPRDEIAGNVSFFPVTKCISYGTLPIVFFIYTGIDRNTWQNIIEFTYKVNRISTNLLFVWYIMI